MSEAHDGDWRRWQSHTEADPDWDALDEGERGLSTVMVTVTHPADWELDDIADELFEWSEGLEDTRLIIHTVSGEQGPAGTPQDDDDDGDDDGVMLVESEAESLEDFEAEMSALREYAGSLYDKEQE
jgi:hypothetical protein